MFHKPIHLGYVDGKYVCYVPAAEILGWVWTENVSADKDLFASLLKWLRRGKRRLGDWNAEPVLYVSWVHRAWGPRMEFVSL